MKRREFIKASALGGSALFPGRLSPEIDAGSGLQDPLLPIPVDGPYPFPDLRPARWIWYPSERTPPNTFVLFRRQLDLPVKAHRARGWVVADGRYLLTVMESECSGGRHQATLVG